MEIPGRGTLVYVSPLTRRVKSLKAVSFVSSILGFYVLPHVVLKTPTFAGQLAAALSISFLIFGTPLLLHNLVKRLVTRIYYNEETNTFTTSTISLFLREKTLSFTPEEVEISPRMVSAIAVQGHHLLISQEDFFDPDMYRKLLDFDKKLAEFNLSPEEEEKLRQEIRMEMEMKTGVDKSQQNFDLSEQQHEDLKRDIEHQARKKGL